MWYFIFLFHGLEVLKQTYKGKYLVSQDQILDPGISQIKDWSAKFCPNYSTYPQVYTVTYTSSSNRMLFETCLLCNL